MPKSPFNTIVLKGFNPGQRLAGFAGCVALCVVAYLVLFGMLSHGVDTQASRFAFLAPLFLSGALFGLNRIFLQAEGWSISAIGLDRLPRRASQFILGFGGGIVLVVVWAVIMAVCMGMRWHRADIFHAPGAFSLVLFTFFLGASEELAYRAYAIVQMSESIGPQAAILATSIVFTILHIQGGVPWLNAIAGVFTCAVLYAVLFERTRSLPVVLGFHIANNMAQNLFGLRGSPLTLIEPSSSNASGAGLTLVLVGAFNLTTAYFLWRVLPGKPAAASL